MIAPIIPGLNEHEIPAIVEEAAGAGARYAGYTPLRLPLAVAPIFEDWLERNVPGKKEKVLNRVRAMRGGKLNDARFGSRLRGEGIFADLIHDLFKLACRQAGIDKPAPKLSTAAFRRPSDGQRVLFE